MQARAINMPVIRYTDDIPTAPLRSVSSSLLPADLILIILLVCRSVLPSTNNNDEDFDSALLSYMQFRTNALQKDTRVYNNREKVGFCSKKSRTVIKQ